MAKLLHFREMEEPFCEKLRGRGHLVDELFCKRGDLEEVLFVEKLLVKEDLELEAWLLELSFFDSFHLSSM